MNAFLIPASCKQCLVVLAEDWTSNQATLYTFEKETTQWQQAFSPCACTLGKAGMSRPFEKKEGDLKTPTGVFSLGPLFGTLPFKEPKMAYVALDKGHFWVDDPKSPFYNQLIHLQEGERGDWDSAECMLLPDGLYERGAFIRYNVDPAVPGAGSCIFIHRQSSKNAPTHGCIGLVKEDLNTLLEWLDEKRHPHIVHLTRELLEQNPPLKALLLQDSNLF